MCLHSSSIWQASSQDLDLYTVRSSSASLLCNAAAPLDSTQYTHPRHAILFQVNCRQALEAKERACQLVPHGLHGSAHPC